MTDQAPTPLDPWSLSPAEATAQLANMKVQYDGSPAPSKPPNGVMAAKRLEHLSNDPAWRDKFERGDEAARAEFAELTEKVASASNADLAIANVLPAEHRDIGPGSHLRDQIEAAKDWRGVEGWTDDMTRMVLEDRVVDDPKVIADAERKYEQVLRDTALIDPKHPNHMQARSDLLRVSAVLVAAGKTVGMR